MTLQFYVHDIVVTDTTEEMYISHDLNTIQSTNFFLII